MRHCVTDSFDNSSLQFCSPSGFQIKPYFWSYENAFKNVHSLLLVKKIKSVCWSKTRLKGFRVIWWRSVQHHAIATRWELLHSINAKHHRILIGLSSLLNSFRFNELRLNFKKVCNMLRHWSLQWRWFYSRWQWPNGSSRLFIRSSRPSQWTWSRELYEMFTIH